MNWRTISASTILAASLLVPMSSIAASFHQTQTSSSYKVQTTAQTPYRGMGKRGKFNQEQRLQRMQQELNLDDSQVEKIKSIYNEAKQDPEMQSLYQDMKAAKEEMGNLMASDNATNEELIEQHNKLQGIRQQLSRKRLDKNLAVREVLTSEQRKKMAELKQQRRQRWKSRRGNR